MLTAPEFEVIVSTPMVSPPSGFNLRSILSIRLDSLLSIVVSAYAKLILDSFEPGLNTHCLAFSSYMT